MIKGGIALLMMASPVLAAGDAWVTDFEAAKKQAKEQKKDLLLEFTGSDWCPPCKALTAKVFSKTEFSDEASKKFVLVLLDFPRRAEQAEALKLQNEKLSKHYGVRGFPSVLLCDAEGMPYASTGFQDLEPVAYAKMLEGLQVEKTSRDEAIKKAMTLQGAERAKALEELLKSIGTKGRLQIGMAFSPILNAIKEADPEDSSGYSTQLLLFGKMANLGPKDDEKPVFAELDAYVKKYNLVGEKKQEALIKKIDVYFARRNFDGMLALLDEVIEVDPETTLAKQLKGAKPRIEQMAKSAKSAPAN